MIVSVPSGELWARLLCSPRTELGGQLVSYETRSTPLRFNSGIQTAAFTGPSLPCRLARLNRSKSRCSRTVLIPAFRRKKTRQRTRLSNLRQRSNYVEDHQDCYSSLDTHSRIKCGAPVVRASRSSGQITVICDRS